MCPSRRQLGAPLPCTNTQQLLGQARHCYLSPALLCTVFVLSVILSVRAGVATCEDRGRLDDDVKPPTNALCYQACKSLKGQHLKASNTSSQARSGSNSCFAASAVVLAKLCSMAHSIDQGGLAAIRDACMPSQAGLIQQQHHGKLYTHSLQGCVIKIGWVLFTHHFYHFNPNTLCMITSGPPRNLFAVPTGSE